MSEVFAPYPYPLHNGRELELILAGEKPLAVFSVERIPGFTKLDALGGQDFAAHVQGGRLIEACRTFTIEVPRGRVPVDYLLYAIPTQAWRIEAYAVLLHLLHEKGGWCGNLEWQQGHLLGYTAEQNLYHLRREQERLRCANKTSASGRSG